MSDWMQEYVSNIGREKSSPLRFYKSRTQRWREELGQVFISLQKESLVIFWPSISPSRSSLKCRVLCGMRRAWTEQLQMAGRHRGGPAGGSNCPAPAPTPAPSPTPTAAPAPTGAPGLCSRPRPALCSHHPSLSQLVERIFFPLYLLSLCELFHRKEWCTPNSAWFLGKL